MNNYQDIERLYASYLANMKRGNPAWYLYHAKQNEGAAAGLFMLSCFLVICNGGIPITIFLWICYFCWSHNNNKELSRNKDILNARWHHFEAYLRGRGYR